MRKRSFLRKSLMALFLAASLFNASALPARAETGMELFKEDPQYGATGYPIVVQSQYQDGFLQPYQEEIVSKMPGLTFLGNTGLYEYNGPDIALLFSKQPKEALVTDNHKNSDGTFSTYTLYCDPQGRIREYTEESRAAIDSEIAEHLAQKS